MSGILVLLAGSVAHGASGPGPDPSPGRNASTISLLQVGLRKAVYDGYHGENPTYTLGKTPTSVTYVEDPSFNGGPAYNTIEFTGWFKAPITDSYAFWTSSDDGSYLWIGDGAVSPTLNNVIVNNGGLHGDNYAESAFISLVAGQYYPIRILVGNGNANYILTTGFFTKNNAYDTNLAGYVFDSIGPTSTVSGAILDLNASAYSGSGDWIDAGPAGANAALVNTPAWNSPESGISFFTFDDTQFQWMQVPNLGSLPEFTISIWVRFPKDPTAAGWDSVANLLTEADDGANSAINFRVGYGRGDFNTLGGTYRISNGQVYPIGPLYNPIALSEWYHFAITVGSTPQYPPFIGIGGSGEFLPVTWSYVNGDSYIKDWPYELGPNFELSQPQPSSGGLPIYIGRRGADLYLDSANSYTAMDISSIAIYNRKLSNSEIGQLYNYEKNRLGLYFESSRQIPPDLSVSFTLDPNSSHGLNWSALGIVYDNLNTWGSSNPFPPALPALEPSTLLYDDSIGTVARFITPNINDPYYDTYIECEPLSIDFGADIVIDMWFYPTEADVQLLYEIGNYKNYHTFGRHASILEIDASGYIKASFWNGTPVTSINQITLNEWNHVYFSEDAGGNHIFKVNGTLTPDAPVYNRDKPFIERFGIGRTDASYDPFGYGGSINMGSTGHFKGDIGRIIVSNYQAASTWVPIHYTTPTGSVGSLNTSQAGLRRSIYNVSEYNNPTYTLGKTPDSIDYDTTISMPDQIMITVEWTGWFQAPYTDYYKFVLSGNTGSSLGGLYIWKAYLWLGSDALTPTTENPIITHDSLGPSEGEYAYAFLTGGEWYPIRILFNNGATDGAMHHNFGAYYSAMNFMQGSLNSVALAASSEVPPNSIALNPYVHLDAAAYSSTGDWIDTGYAGANASLDPGIVTPPTWNNGYGGYFTFDKDLMQYSQMPSIGILSDITITGWVRFSQAPSGAGCILTEALGNGSAINFSVGDLYENGSIAGGYYLSGFGPHYKVPGFIPTLGEWYNFAWSLDSESGHPISNKFFLNGDIINDTGSVGATAVSGTGSPLYIGRRWDAATYLGMDLASLVVYDRALTNAEIAQNFDKDKYKFGKDLVLSPTNWATIGGGVTNSLSAYDPGLRRSLYAGYHGDDPIYPLGKTPDSTTVITSSWASDVDQNDVTAEWTGWFDAPYSDFYTFRLNASAGSTPWGGAYMWIGSTAIEPTAHNHTLNNISAGPSYSQSIDSELIYLEGGTHYPIRVLYGVPAGGDVASSFGFDVSYNARNNMSTTFATVLDSGPICEIFPGGLVGTPVLHLQAATYSGTGDWIDAGTAGSNATMDAANTVQFEGTNVVPPVWNSSYGGYFSFDKTQKQFTSFPARNITRDSNVDLFAAEKVDVPSYTVTGWFRLNQPLTHGTCLLTQFEPPWDTDLTMMIGDVANDGGFYGGWYNSLWHADRRGFTYHDSFETYVYDGKWYNFAYVVDTTVIGADPDFSTVTTRNYINGVLTRSVIDADRTTPRILNTPTDFFIGRRFDDPTNVDSYISGDVASMTIYDRALTAEEIAQNFDSAKYRFGLDLKLSR